MHTYLFGPPYLKQRSAILTWLESSSVCGFALLPFEGDVCICALILQTAALKRFSSRCSLKRYPPAGWSLSSTTVPVNTWQSSSCPLVAPGILLLFILSSAAILRLQTVSSVLVNWSWLLRSRPSFSSQNIVCCSASLRSLCSVIQSTIEFSSVFGLNLW